mmetsp:Transcript_12716/g.24125  ORF Transcript_12716/g.24125 Transcript_12716/m.24125 type:complete len:96 (+) Transcript_12716:186-473(+)
MPNALQTPVHLLCASGLGTPSTTTEAAAASASQAFQDLVCDTILAGGCNASRAIFAGACFGAYLGADAVPSEWKSKAHSYQETLVLARQLAVSRS